MASKKLTKADLSWFKYMNYSEKHLSELGLDGWCQVIASRLAVRQMSQYGSHDLALEGMAVLQSDPLATLGFDLPTILGRDPADTATVLPIRSGMVASYAFEALRGKFPAGSVFDEQRNLTAGVPWQWATIQVDLRAKRSQVRKDFDAWLAAISKRSGDCRGVSFSVASSYYPEMLFYGRRYPQAVFDIRPMQSITRVPTIAVTAWRKHRLADAKEKAWVNATLYSSAGTSPGGCYNFPGTKSRN